MTQTATDRMKLLAVVSTAFLIIALITDPVTTSEELVCDELYGTCETVETVESNSWWYLIAITGGIGFSISVTWFIVYSAVVEGNKTKDERSKREH